VTENFSPPPSRSRFNIFDLICITHYITAMSDFITTIDSDDEYDVPVQNGESSRQANAKTKGKGKNARSAIPDLEDEEGEGEMNGAKGKKESKDLNPEFTFDGDGARSEGLDLWGGDEVQEKGKGEVRPPSNL
jgi:hypothetical protein